MFEGGSLWRSKIGSGREKRKKFAECEYGEYFGNEKIEVPPFCARGSARAALTSQHVHVKPHAAAEAMAMANQSTLSNFF